MENLSRTAFIADLVHAAHKMGIGLREVIVDGEYRFDWLDGMTQVMVVGEVAKDRINAFELACYRLQEYLKLHPQ